MFSPLYGVSHLEDIEAHNGFQVMSDLGAPQPHLDHDVSAATSIQPSLIEELEQSHAADLHRNCKT